MDRKLKVVGSLSLVLHKGHLGIWSRDERAESHCIWLDRHQAAVLLAFAEAPQTPAQAAAAANVEHNESFDKLVDDFLRRGILTEDVESCHAPFYRMHHPSMPEDVPICVLEPNALNEAHVRGVIDGLRSSGLVGRNVLSDGFAGSLGFGVKFRRESLSQLLALLPWARPFFDIIMNESISERLGPLRGGVVERPNAFYFNALVIPPGKGTALHFDRTLDNRTNASWVSVLYLAVTAPPGGRLFLYDGAWPVGLVNPQPGMIAHFSGSLRHGVSDTTATDGERVSLVCEHYCLPEASLKRCPYFELVKLDE